MWFLKSINEKAVLLQKLQNKNQQSSPSISWGGGQYNAAFFLKIKCWICWLILTICNKVWSSWIKQFQMSLKLSSLQRTQTHQTQGSENLFTISRRLTILLLHIARGYEGSSLLTGLFLFTLLTALSQSTLVIS